MDYKEEQNNEIEALDSIYCGELEILTTEPYHRFLIPIKSEEYEPDTENGMSCKLKFSYTDKYPDEPPEVEVTETSNLEDVDTDLLTQHILKEAEDNLGTVMIFTLVSSAQEWLNMRWDEVRNAREEAERRKEIEAEEAERKRFEGTRVTVETFLAWKAAFDAEFNLKKKPEKEEKDSKKMTGRELFLSDKSLYESDLKFLEDGGDTIKVDESLFQDMDELDLDDEDELDEEDSS
ncbi:RWD domain-containing protein 1 [Schistocerca nitens]|uniref:RWD domain-containing protein 1 n=1 Tax=Schistocerca nitens TaxID=7011 RepID=UPI0021196A34|nr:RWD domain-containing protein 1 [Schistocerca nitens]